MKKISAVLICKNESAMIENCINSLKGVDEIVICDTGSTDNTVEIASKYTDNIQYFEWCDDFGAARNYAKSFATNDWILSIDCDEVIETERGIERLNALINNIDDSVDAIHIELWDGFSQRLHAVRLFKKDIDWKGAIHETISGKNMIKTDITIKFGRSPTHDEDPLLDLRILEKEHEKNPECTRTMFYLAREYMYHKMYDKSEEMFEKYIPISLFITEKVEALFLLSQCYWYDGKGNGNKARETCIKAIQLNPNFKSAIELFAEMHYEPAKSRWKSFAEGADNSGLLFIH